MHGIARVTIFCLLTTILPTILLIIPLYLRHSLYANVVYNVAESDILEIEDGISTIFCSGHTLKMNSSFHAFKVSQQPEIASYRKHIRLKKSMTLPDDTLEYWGFYLLKGATVALSVCSRFQGASILVVRGERNLRTCGMMEHNQNKKKFKENYIPSLDRQLEVKFRSNTKDLKPWEVKAADAKSAPLIPNKMNLSTFNGEKNSMIPKNPKTLNISEPANLEDRELNLLRESAMNYIRKHTVQRPNVTGAGIMRHMKKRLLKVIDKAENEQDQDEKEKEFSTERDERVKELEMELNSDIELMEDDSTDKKTYERNRRNANGINPPLLLDRGVEHGGNAINYTNLNKESSISSFEDGLLSCYAGQVLLAQEFEPSDLCTNISFLVSSKRIQTEHRVTESGYYYYIFYSDNDFVSNDMHAVFDIYKPTFKFGNQTQSCINKTECSFDLGFLSGERVIVEVPTKDGIDHTEGDITLLTSTCRPRMAIYTIFPIAVISLVLGCAFL